MSVLLPDRRKLVLDDALDARARAQDVEIVGDLGGELVELLLDLVAAERGEPLQAQVENGLGLLGGKPGRARGRHPVARVIDQRNHGGDVARRPVARHQRLARLVGVAGGTNEPDHLVDIGDRDGKSHQHMGAVARLAEQEFAAPRHHLLAEGNERGEHVLEIHHQRPAAVERDHVGAEGGLQRREAVELVENDLALGVALELDHDAIALPVRLVAQVGDAVDLLLAHELGDALHHRGLVHLVGDLGDDDGLPLLADGLEGDLAAHHDRAAAALIGAADAGMAKDDSAGGKIRTGHDPGQLVERKFRLVDQRHACVDHLAQIVRRDVGRHADGDAAGAVDEQVGKARRQHHRLLLRAVVIGLEVDGILVDVVEQRHRRPRETAFGIAHGRRRIAVDRAEIALPVDQHQAHGEVLRHAHERVVDRLVAMRMVFAHHVADHA